MDSFYDAPRRPPNPTQLDQDFVTPTVPEVSLIALNKNYNSSNPTFRHTNKENFNYHQIVSPRAEQDSSLCSKKQVRFEAPAKNPLNVAPFQSVTNNCNNVQSAEDYRNYMPCAHPPKGMFDGKTFEQIYLANIPVRQLDLSLIEPPQNATQKKTSLDYIGTIDGSNNKAINPHQAKENVKISPNRTSVINNKSNKESVKQQSPKNYKEFRQLRGSTAGNKGDIHNDSVTDIFNYGRRNEGSDQQDKIIKNISNQQTTIPPFFNYTLGLGTANTYGEQTTSNGIGHNRDFNQKATNENILNTKYNYQTNINTNFNHNVTRSEDTHMIISKTLSKCNSETQTSNSHLEKYMQESSRPSDEPTVKDLLKIIQQQNEQLLLLQRQVANLMEQKETQKEIEGPIGKQQMHYSETYMTSTQHDQIKKPLDVNGSSPRKGPLSKFSIDMMTSFEVSFRQQNILQRRLNKDFGQHEARIQEVTETESTSTQGGDDYSNDDQQQVDASMHLQQPLQVREDCPSPEPSININMNDYDSSDDNSETTEDGMAFYSNLMAQVNNILEKAQIQTNDLFEQSNCPGRQISSNKLRNKTMNKVKEATLKHLKSIGVTLPNMDDLDDGNQANNSCEYSPTEISFAVKQLLMKYLPDEHLVKINQKQGAVLAQPTKDEDSNLILPRPEFSFATVQYMKKYNLLANNGGCQAEPPTRDNIVFPQHKQVQQLKQIVLPKNPVGAQKILDITALKQQPKLL